LCLPLAPANAQATRTWVSGVGDDANPCSRTAPCKTFAGSIVKTSAGGEINCLDPGGFGAVTITKSIIISCEMGTAGVLVSGTNGIVVNAATTDIVFLKGLDFEGLQSGLSGVLVLQAAAVHVDKCLIRGFTTAGINMNPANSGAELYVQDTYIADNNVSTASGILIKPQNNAATTFVIANTQSNNNIGRGLLVDTSNANSTVRGTVTGSAFNGNTLAGVVATSNGGAIVNVMIDQISASNNGSFGVTTAAGNVTIQIGRSTISGNATGIQAQSGTILSYGNNEVSGNTTGNGSVNGPANVL
jgi:hypothetical protein